MYAYCLCMLFYNVSMVRFMNSCQDIGFSSLLQSISILKLGELKSMEYGSIGSFVIVSEYNVP